MLTWNRRTPKTPYAKGKAESTNGNSSSISGASTTSGSVKYFTISGGSLLICLTKKHGINKISRNDRDGKTSMKLMTSWEKGYWNMFTKIYQS